MYGTNAFGMFMSPFSSLAYYYSNKVAYTQIRIEGSFVWRDPKVHFFEGGGGAAKTLGDSEP